MAAAKMKADEDATVKDEIDLTLYDATPEPERRPNVAPPSFEGRLNLKEYAFQQPTKPFRRNRPAPKVEESNFDIVKKEQNSPNKGSKGSLNRPLVLTPTPIPEDARVTVKREVKVERAVEVVTAPASEVAADNSPDQSSREPSTSDIAPRRRRRLVSGRRELSDLFNDDGRPPAPARPGPSVVPAARSPFFAATSSTVVASSSKRASDSSNSGSPTKKARALSSYKPPETYAHLEELTDLMAPDLLGIFVGVNPGLKSAALGHSYASPSNRFWKLLHTSGITERRLPPQEDATLPVKYQFGNTNIVGRPTRNQMELSKHEMVDSVQALIGKVRKWKPESVVIVGKKIWEIIFSVRHGRGIKKHEFNYGWQADSERMGTPKSWEKEETTVDGKPWKGARVFVASTTSGAAAVPPGPERERIWRELGEWVNKRREERGLTHYPPGPTYEKNL